MELAKESDEWLSRLEEVSYSGDAGVGGFDVCLWEDSTWILHAMYEASDAVPESWGRDDLEAFSRFERPNFARVKPIAWASEVVRNLGGQDPVLLEKYGFAPAKDWIFPRGFVWGQVPPPEGSLDEASFDALLEILAHGSPSGRETPILALYTNTAVGQGGNRGLMLEGVLGELRGIIDAPWIMVVTPNNFWPVDLSWFVWTDIDLVATKVSGPKELIDAIRQSDRIEHFDEPC